MGASIVAGVDAAPVFEPPEHDPDLVALAIEGNVVRDRHLAVTLDGMHIVDLPPVLRTPWVSPSCVARLVRG